MRSREPSSPPPTRSGAAGAAVVARFGPGLDLVEEVDLLNLTRLPRQLRIDRSDAVVPQQSHDDVPCPLQNLLVGQLDAVARLKHTNPLGDILQEQAYRRGRRGFLPRTGGGFSGQDARIIVWDLRSSQPIKMMTSRNSTRRAADRTVVTSDRCVKRDMEKDMRYRRSWLGPAPLVLCGFLLGCESGSSTPVSTITDTGSLATRLAQAFCARQACCGLAGDAAMPADAGPVVDGGPSCSGATASDASAGGGGSTCE